jgi:hypothetical protein
MEQALKAAVEHEGSCWDDVASDAGFTFLWETEAPLPSSRVPSRPSSGGLSYRSNSSILKDLDALRKVHDDIFEINTSLTGRRMPTTAEHSGRLSGALHDDTPIVAASIPTPTHDGRHSGGGVSEAADRIKGIALSDRDARWEKRRLERAGGVSTTSSSAVPPGFSGFDDSDALHHRRRSTPRADSHLLGRAGSEVVLGGHAAKPGTAGGSTARYNVITGQFEGASHR